MVGSPPPLLDATMISRLSLLHSLPRLASTAPLARLIFAQCEWPDMLRLLARSCKWSMLILRRGHVPRKAGTIDAPDKGWRLLKDTPCRLRRHFRHSRP